MEEPMMQLYMEVNQSRGVSIGPPVGDSGGNTSEGPGGSGQPSSPVGGSVTLTVPAVMFATGVLGNCLALAVLARSSKEHRGTVFYRLVGGLACTDLFGTLALSPVTLLGYSEHLQLRAGQPLCNYFSFMMIFAGMATVLIVGVMAVERYVSILHPYVYGRRVGVGGVKYVLGGVYVFSLLTAILPLLGLGSNVVHYPGTWCFFDYFGSKVTDRIYNYFYSSLGLLIILMTAVCNVAVMCVLMKMRMSARDRNLWGQGQQAYLDGETQMILLLAGILLVFATCYAPLMVRVIINQAGTRARDMGADLLAIRLACINQILDPWVYILFRRKLLYRFFRLLKRRLPFHRKRTTKPEAACKDCASSLDSNASARRPPPPPSPRPLRFALLEELHCCKGILGKRGERKDSRRGLLVPMTSYSLPCPQPSGDAETMSEAECQESSAALHANEAIPALRRCSSEPCDLG